MPATADGDAGLWSVQPARLGSNGQAADYVVETDNDANLLLRFGGGGNGRSPGATEGVTLERYTEKGKTVVFLALPKGSKYGTPIVHEGRHTVRIER